MEIRRIGLSPHVFEIQLSQRETRTKEGMTHIERIGERGEFHSFILNAQGFSSTGV